MTERQVIFITWYGVIIMLVSWFASVGEWHWATSIPVGLFIGAGPALIDRYIP